MKVILLKDMGTLGAQYETVEVKAGYGRNFLIPQRKAVVANAKNANQYGELLKQIRVKQDRAMAELQKTIDTLKASPLNVGVKVGTSGKIFGSVTNVQLADAIKKETGLTIDRRKITITDTVKEVGTYEAVLDMGEEVKETITFEVVGE